MTATSSLHQEQDYVNNIALSYEESAFDRCMRGYMIRTFTPYLPTGLPAGLPTGLPAGRALQMGCFHGDFTEELARLYKDLTVVDAAQIFLDHTRHRVGNHLKTHQALFEEFTTPEKFDAIFIIHVLEHLLDPVAVLKRAKTMLAPGGRLFIAVPNGQAISRMIAVKMDLIESLGSLTAADLQHGHRRVYFLDTLEKDMNQAGLKCINSGGIFFKVMANFQFDQLIGGPVISDKFLEGCFELGKQYPHFCASIYTVCEGDNE